MNISKEDVVKTLRLARLEVPDAELPDLVREFDSIVKYVEAVAAVDLRGVEPLSHGGEARDVFRDDVVTPSLPADVAIGNAPDTAGGCFRVPRVIAEPS